MGLHNPGLPYAALAAFLAENGVVMRAEFDAASAALAQAQQDIATLRAAMTDANIAIPPLVSGEENRA